MKTSRARVPSLDRWLVLPAVLIALALVYTAFQVLVSRNPESSYADVRVFLFVQCQVLAAVVCIERAMHIREGRTGWVLVAGGMSFYAAGAFALQFLPATAMWEVPYASLADLLSLVSYPFFAAGLIVLLRERAGRVSGGLWLDSLLGSLTVAALAMFVLLGPIAQATGSGSNAITLAFPLADTVIVMILVSGLIIVGRSPGPSWITLVAGFLVFAVGDAIHVFQVATSSSASVPLDLAWVAGTTLIAIAGWLPQRPARLGEVRPRLAYLVPLIFTSIAFALLALEFYLPDSRWGFYAALAAVGLAIPRILLASRDGHQLAEAGKQARTDELTGMGNRRYFFEAFREASRRGDEPVALCILDLDRFKDVNDSYGHRMGDELLIRVSKRLSEAVRPNDVVTRIGGDEFGLIFTNVSDPQAALARANRLVETISQPFRVGSLQFHVGASAGVSLWPAQGTDTETLLANADMAMYEAKRARGGALLYSDATFYEGRDRLRKVHEIRKALEQDEMRLYYQPIMDLARRQFSGVEALVRWVRPDGEVLLPETFLPLLRDAGLHETLTHQVLSMAVAKAAEWHAAGSDLTVSLNVSAVDILGPDFPKVMSDCLQQCAAPPSAIRVEITEESLMSDFRRARQVLASLRELGVSIAIDDFGVGYSSLSQLHHLEVDCLKIDGAIVAAMLRNPRAEAIVRSSITLAHGLGMVACAEGVENQEVMTRLKLFGCDLVQGYLIARPGPGDMAVVMADEFAASQGWKPADEGLTGVPFTPGSLAS